jgi:hypothetical protein
MTPTLNSDGSSNNSSMELAIGAGVGVPLGILAVAMLGIGFRWGRRRPRRRGNEIKSTTEVSTGGSGNDMSTIQEASASTGSGMNAVHEVPANTVGCTELPGTNEYQGP